MHRFIEKKGECYALKSGELLEAINEAQSANTISHVGPFIYELKNALRLANCIALAPDMVPEKSEDRKQLERIMNDCEPEIMRMETPFKTPMLSCLIHFYPKKPAPEPAVDEFKGRGYGGLNIAYQDEQALGRVGEPVAPAVVPHNAPKERKYQIRDQGCFEQWRNTNPHRWADESSNSNKWPNLRILETDGTVTTPSMILNPKDPKYQPDYKYWSGERRRRTRFRESIEALHELGNQLRDLQKSRKLWETPKRDFGVTQTPKKAATDDRTNQYLDVCGRGLRKPDASGIRIAFIDEYHAKPGLEYCKSIDLGTKGTILTRRGDLWYEWNHIKAEWQHHEPIKAESLNPKACRQFVEQLLAFDELEKKRKEDFYTLCCYLLTAKETSYQTVQYFIRGYEKC